MLLLREVNKKSYETHTAEEVAKMFGVPLDKLKKTPEFHISDSRVGRKSGQSKEISHATGTTISCNMVVVYKNKSYELRYAESINEEEIDGKLIKKYEPRKERFMGAVQFIDKFNEDLLVYVFLYYLCENSPFRYLAKGTPHYKFKDIEAQSELEMSGYRELMTCINTIDQMSGDPLRIMAKAFGVTGTETMEDVTVKNKLIEEAKKDPVSFNKSANSNVHLFKGIVVNAVDNGTFVMKEIGRSNFWVWDKGESKGTRIVEIYDNGMAKLEQLVTYISEHITEYYPVLVNAQKAQKAKSAAERFFDSQPNLDLNDIFGSEPSEAKIKKEKKLKPEEEFGGGSDEVSDIITNDERPSGDDLIEEEIEDVDFNEPEFVSDIPVGTSDLTENRQDEAADAQAPEQQADDVPDFLKHPIGTARHNKPPKTK